MSGLQKDSYHGTRGIKEGLSSIGRFRSNVTNMLICSFIVHNKPLGSLFWLDKHHRLYHKQDIDCKHMITLIIFYVFKNNGRKVEKGDFGKEDVFLQPWLTV